MAFGVLFALLSPFFFSTAGVIDKYIISHKIRKILGYTALTGPVTVIFGAILALGLPWEGIILSQFVFPVISGAIIGGFVYLWLWTLQREDVSNFIGFLYLYPAVVAVLAFFLLKETIPAIGYTGMALTLLGVSFLASRSAKFQKNPRWMPILAAILVLSVNSLVTKVAATNMPSLNAVAVSVIIEGIVISIPLLSKKVWKEFLLETSNTGWAFFSEIFNNLGFIAMFLAYSLLPATIVTSMAAIQPAMILLVERVVDAKVGKISKDHFLLPRLWPILLITAGTVMLAIAGFG